MKKKISFEDFRTGIKKEYFPLTKGTFKEEIISLICPLDNTQLIKSVYSQKHGLPPFIEIYCPNCGDNYYGVNNQKEVERKSKENFSEHEKELSKIKNLKLDLESKILNFKKIVR